MYDQTKTLNCFTQGILTAQITTVHNQDNFDTTEYASSSNEANPANNQASSKIQRRTKLKKKQPPNIRKSMLATGISPIKRFLKIYLPFIHHISFLALIFTCAALWPSLLSIPYLLFFIFFMTKWSVTKRDQYGKSDYVIKLFLVFYLAAHILIYYMYQFRLFQIYAQDDSLTSRLMGFNKILFTKCEQPAHFFFNMDLKWQQLAYPFVLLSLYWFLTLELSYVSEKSDQDSLFSPPKSSPIPRLPTVAVGRLVNGGEVKLFINYYDVKLTFLVIYQS